jgi:hypothetical protein
MPVVLNDTSRVCCSSGIMYDNRRVHFTAGRAERYTFQHGRAGSQQESKCVLELPGTFTRPSMKDLRLTAKMAACQNIVLNNY